MRRLDDVRLLDLADLRARGAADAAALAAVVAAVEDVIDLELARYRRWFTGHQAAAAIRTMRRDAESVAEREFERVAREMPAELRPLLERALRRTVQRLVHGPTRELLAAAEAGDLEAVSVLSGLYRTGGAATAISAPDDPHAAARLHRPPLDVKRSQVSTGQHALHQGGVHAADELAV